MTPDELSKLLAMPKEGAALEFKEAKSQFDVDTLCRYCVAIANEGGGKLVLGVTDKHPRRVVGTNALRDPDEIQKKLLSMLRIHVQLEEIRHADGRIVVCHIPPRPKGTAYQHNGAYLMRAGDGTVAMTEDRLRKIFDEGKPEWLSVLARENCSADEIVQLLDTQSYFDMLKVPYPATRDAVLDRFERERLIVRNAGIWSITNLGGVLFAKRLEDFGGLARKAPRVVVYEGTSKIKTRLDKPGTKGYAVGFEGLIDFINGQIPANEVIGRALRQEIKMFPEISVRELVANALIHQDFSETGTSVMIEIYSDRMEISSPGVPFISLERFIDEYQSRNEKLADLMRRLGVCEEKGSGIDKVVQSAEVYQLPAPDFRVAERHTVAVLFAHKTFDDMDRNDRVRACYQHCCLRYVMNEKMTNQSLRERFQLPESKAETASRVIRETLQSEKIKLDDPSNTSKRYAKYVPYWA